VRACARGRLACYTHDEIGAAVGVSLGEANSETKELSEMEALPKQNKLLATGTCAGGWSPTGRLRYPTPPLGAGVPRPALGWTCCPGWALTAPEAEPMPLRGQGHLGREGVQLAGDRPEDRRDIA